MDRHSEPILPEHRTGSSRDASASRMGGTPPLTSAGSARPAVTEEARAGTWRWLGVYFLLGILFGLALIKGEVVSWFRIQEMFRFQAFYLWGVFMTAFAVATPSVYLIKRSGLHAATGEAIQVPPKQLGRGYRYWIGGSLFGVGLTITGACPGPLLSLIGSGYLVMAVVLASALAGSWTYGYLRPRLPH